MFDHLARPLLFAHRGASIEAPENTLESFSVALDVGANVLELDVHLSQDEQVVVFHDETLDRTTNGSGEVREHSLAELKRLDAGFRFLGPQGERTHRERGVQIPTLAEVFEAFPSAAFNIELKTAEPRLVEETLKLLNPLRDEQVLLTAGQPEVMTVLEAAAPRGTGDGRRAPDRPPVGRQRRGGHAPVLG